MHKKSLKIPLTDPETQKKDLNKCSSLNYLLFVDNYAGLIASEGQTSAQVPQSVQTSASIT